METSRLLDADIFLGVISGLLAIIGAILIILLKVQITLNKENAKEHEDILLSIQSLLIRAEQITENKENIEKLDERVSCVEKTYVKRKE